MKRIFKIALTLIFFSLLSSCDPMSVLLVENRTGNDVEVDILLQDCKDSFIKELKWRRDFEKITLGTDEQNRTRTFMFGIGGWTKSQLKSLNECTKSIKIREMGKPIREIKGEELKRYLPQRRKNLMNNVIKIKILK